MADTNNGIESFISGLQSLWSAEKQLTESMPLMIKQATNIGLKKNLALHLAETDQHKVALEGICKELGYEHEGEENNDMKKLLEEGSRKVSTQVSDAKADAAIIEGAIKIEHYEIERYTAVANTAKALGYEGIAARLNLTLEEERQADTKLNFLHRAYVEQTSVIGAPGLALK